MRRGGWAIAMVLCGMLVVVLVLWQAPQVGMQPLKMRPYPQISLQDSVLDRGKININVASEQQLDQLPGIGPALAQAIVQFRKEHGYFAYPEHLIRVPGISKTIMQSLLELICV